MSIGQAVFLAAVAFTVAAAMFGFSGVVVLAFIALMVATF
jgi:hypothetical protein